MRTHTIYVKQEHINAGRKHDCRRCPIALALIDHFGSNDAFTCDFNMDAWGGIAAVRAKRVPTVCIDFMANFDSGKEVQPFSFTADFEYA